MKQANEFVHAHGNLAFVNLILKYAVLVLGIAVTCLSVLVILLGNKARDQKPLPIFIDRVSGEAVPVDWAAVDAEGEDRVLAEVEDFVRNTLHDMYTYNKHTVRSNLENVFKVSTPQAGAQIKASLDLAERADAIARNGQGLCKVQSVTVLEGGSSIRVQVILEKEVVNLSGELDGSSRVIALIRLKPIKRQVGNAHGLAVVEYAENEYEGGTS